ncbi:tyrosine-type recombinase/integrase [Limnovirga soli]|uniref:Tyrosine-type recombinase/integrase n=1 Tax=Limnovirga soli TaxID=2656915 RepID=A0A8J8FG89_9BACT|nr:phage integrase SAM-like domain-containing protein [Limnovirga soli]NNV57343.1 tyrosine-type recombinase/integrase [Limnovirga soli]
MTSFLFKKAKLYFAKGDLSKEWYIEYYYLKPGTTDTYQRFKERFNINRIPNLQDRLAYGNEFVKFMNKKLQSGWSPYTAIEKDKQEMPPVLDQLQLIIRDLTASASKYKIDTLNEQLNRFKKFVEAHNLESFSMQDFTEQQADDYRVYMDKELDLSVKTINSSLSYFTAIWKHAIKVKKWCLLNPFDNIDRMKKTQKPTKVERFEPISSKELDIILHNLREGQQPFIVFLGMIYFAWARPAEIARLKIADIDLQQNIIRFPKGETKNKQGAYVQIVPPLKKLLASINLQNYPGNYYIFSGDSTGFMPGKTKLNRQRATARWLDTVKNGMGITKDMYALKHTGNIDYLLNNKDNIDLKWQQMQNRHSSSAMTERYNRKLGAYFINCSNLHFRDF